ncbi:U6 snRNA-associated Sm-like protein LSm1 [Bolinopsis microptera]|uniref:U6 snRNA-associated Sm-like protein LSm1 n=1 Tax=Bolinopsis microptera TaxID=2820187 RepID=UPI0030792214
MSNLVDDLGQEMLYLPGTAALVQDIDKRMMVVLRDGRTLIGFLRSLDQFANLLLTQTIERIHVRDKYGDIDRGVFLIRGENVVLCGEVDFQNSQFKNLIQVSQEEILTIQAEELKEKEEKQKILKKAFQERGVPYYSIDSMADDAF